MSKYRITLTVHETGDMSKEDFRRLQEAVDTIAGLTDFRMVIDQNAMSAQQVATVVSMVPREALRFTQPNSMELVGNFIPPNENDITHKDVYGQEEWPGFDWNKAMK